MSVLMDLKQGTTEKQARMCIELCSDKHITLTTQVWIEWPVPYKLMPETPRFPSHNEGICSPLRSLPQSVEREYQRSAPVVQVSRYILQIATVASSVHTSQPRCDRHGFTKVIEQSDYPCLSDQRVACV